MWLVVVLVIVAVAALYAWLGSIWLCVAVFSLACAVYLFLLLYEEDIVRAMQREIAEAVLRRNQADSFPLDVFIPIEERLDSITQMIEFVGEQYIPNFAEAVKDFKSVQEEERRGKVQRETEERRFKETLDASVRDARQAREKEANTMREKLRTSHYPD